MSNHIIWIDDRADDMGQIVNGMFRELWKHGVSSKTLFFGDACKEVDDKMLKTYQSRVADVFYDLHGSYKCLEDQVDSDEYEYEDEDEKAKVKEICNNLNTVYAEMFDEQNLCPSAERISLQADIKKIANMWKSEICRDDWSNEKELPKEYGLEPLWAILDPQITGVVALDVILLDGDENKLNCEVGKGSPVISMEFYRHITQGLRCPCVLYTRYTYLNRLQNNWTELYKARYGETGEEPKIYSRQLLYKGGIDQKVLEVLLARAQGGGGSDSGQTTENP